MSRLPHSHLAVVLLGLGATGAALAQHTHGPTAGAPSRCAPEHAAMGHCSPAAAPPGQHEAQHEERDDDAACTPEHAELGHCSPAPAKPEEECAPAHAAMGHCKPAPTTPPDDCTPEHAAMGHCAPRAGLQQPREPIPPLTDADRAAAFPVLSHAGMEHGPAAYSRVKFNRFEAWDGKHARGQAWEGSGSVGGDIHRLWLRSSGQREAGRTTSANVELRYSRAVARWWDVVAGVRQDVRPASRTRAAFGVQGIAPYMWEVSAIAYIGDGGGVAAKLEAEYDLRFTNRLVLQPLLEIELHSQDDPARGVGSGLSKAEAGLRLRYEATRRFAPYIGVSHERTFGRTADFHAADGEASRDTRVVAGVRFWF
ncbi:copper resistance protein B [Luteimonas viscosa]|uniref:Copper resistance protein B n=1 Tax=Luteimonas viscosa TaxID=1132694 RepID=A0A5D4XNB9_9GAMM|nr:copper resistance protein B [Luteimonas viscosa]TYT26069.1 copper resistance protein B [Luteimonas viscosa]